MNQISDRPALLSLRVVADKAGFSYESAYAHFQKGNLKATRVGGLLVVFEEDANDFIAKYKAGTWPVGRKH